MSNFCELCDCICCMYEKEKRDLKISLKEKKKKIDSSSIHEVYKFLKEYEQVINNIETQVKETQIKTWVEVRNFLLENPLSKNFVAIDDQLQAEMIRKGLIKL